MLIYTAIHPIELRIALVPKAVTVKPALLDLILVAGERLADQVVIGKKGPAHADQVAVTKPQLIFCLLQGANETGIADRERGERLDQAYPSTNCR